MEHKHETVEYFVRTMLSVGVEREKILEVSRSMVLFWGVKSENEAEMLTRGYLDSYDKHGTL